MSMDDFEDGDIDGVKMTAQDIFLVVQSVRFSDRYWKEVLEQHPDDNEAITMNNAFDMLIEKIDALEESIADFEDVEPEPEPQALPDNVLNFPGVETSEA